MIKEFLRLILILIILPNILFAKSGFFQEGINLYNENKYEDAKFKFAKSGIYLYQCTPHKAMGMIGLVVVGNDLSNLDKIKKVKVYGKSKKLLKGLLKSIS